MRFLAALAILVSALPAQTSPDQNIIGIGQTIPFGRIILFPPALQQYFEFSAAQLESIQRLNGALQQLQIEKLARATRVQLEITQETAKPTLDAMALGLRYLELEAIQREVRTQRTKTYDEIQKLLTPAQKTKLEALAAAMRLQSVICEAQAQNILAVPTPANRLGNFVLGGDGQGGVASFLLGLAPTQVFPGLPGCVYPTSLIRGGDFTNILPGLNP